ncbi:major facilitator superfamily domain-containing protein [Fennellomyces sp. T-0311]|nr:major facilitator superfamily domain-containing protein [Fennellomyces sp. T-0311]
MHSAMHREEKVSDSCSTLPVDRQPTSSDTLNGIMADQQNEEQPQKKSVFEKIRMPATMFAIILSMFVMSLNSTVVAPAMSLIASELDAIEKQTWIATSFMVALIAFQPIAGKFSDIFGRKPLLLFGQCFFFIGSLITAVSPTMDGLIAGRTIQGFGAGGIMSMLFVVVSDVTTLKWRPRVQSILAAIYGISSVVGPLIGGAFVDYLSWRWDFWLNIIVGGTATVLLGIFFKEPIQVRKESLRDKIQRIDFLGIFFSVACVTCLLLALNWGPVYGWSSAHSIGPFCAAGVAIIGLIITEGWVAKEPIIPPQVVFKPSVFTVYLYMICLGIGFVGTLYFGPILFQSVFGANSTESGIRLIPFIVCLIIGSAISGIFLPIFPYFKVYVVIGAASNLIGYGLFSTVNEGSNWGTQAGFLTFCGLASGLSQQNCILAVQSAVKKEYMAVATSLNNFFMIFASAVGIAIYQTLFATFLTSEVKKLDPQVLAVAMKYGAIENFLHIRNMPVEVQGPVIQAYMHALHSVFYAPLVASAIGVIAALFLRNVRYGGAESKEGPSTEEKGESLHQFDMSEGQKEQGC